MKKDIDMSIFLEDAERYADLVNVSGELKSKKVRAEDVKPYETREWIRLGKNDSRRLSRQRDMVRKVIFGMNVAILEVELQETIDYSYPLRDMGYLFGEYEQQAREVRRNFRRKRKQGKGKYTDGEYLYAFTKESKLRPAVIFMLYFGKEEWDGPRNLHDMLDFTDIPEEMKRYVQNHEINIIDVRRLSEDTLDKFQTDVGKVFKLIKNADHKEYIRKLVETDSYYSKMEEDAYVVTANYIAEPGLLNYEKYEIGGRVNMCKAIREMIEEGRVEGRIKILVDLVNDQVINISEAAKRMEMPEEEFRKVMKDVLNNQS